MLLHVLAVICAIGTLRLLWSRRKWYWLSWQMEGPIGLPLIGNTFLFWDISKITYVLDRLSAKYQRGVRIWMGNRFFVLYSDPASCEAVLNSPDALMKGASYKYIGRMMGGDGLTSSSGDEWKMHRKLLNPTFQNFNILSSFYPIFNLHLRKLTENLGKCVDGQEIDMYHYLEACTFDSTCATTLGRNMHVQDGQNTDFLENANTLLAGATQRMFQPWMAYDAIYQRSHTSRICEPAKDACRSYALRIIEERIAEIEQQAADARSIPGKSGAAKQRNIFIDECIRVTQVNKSFTIEDIVNESVIAIFGGFETTAVTVAYITLMLAMHPEYQERVFDELRLIIPNQTEDVSAEHLAQLDYTNRAIKESMRLNTTIPIISRIVEKDIQVGEHTIPSGTEVVMSIHTMHRRPDIWGADSHRYDPDRFLPENIGGKHPCAFLPYSVGPRNCIGLKYAHIVIRIFVVWLVRNYRFTTTLKLSDFRQRMTLSLKLDNGHMVRVHRRETY